MTLRSLLWRYEAAIDSLLLQPAFKDSLERTRQPNISEKQREEMLMIPLNTYGVSFYDKPEGPKKFKPVKLPPPQSIG